MPAYMDTDEIHTAALIIGSGIAGLLTAIELADTGVPFVLACKGSLSESNSTRAQGGMAAVTAFTDSPQSHVEDTIKSGSGLADRTVVEAVVGDAPGLVARLEELNVNFDRQADGHFDLAREGGHGQARVLHSKDATGLAITGSLIDQLRRRQRRKPDKVQILEHASAMDLITSQERVVGCRFVVAGRPLSVLAPYTVLATGGAGQIYARTTNPRVATADGVAMAYRAGATLVDLEFMQFHPTALSRKGLPPILISEAVRGAGAVLKDKFGRPFTARFHPEGDLSTRDVVARAIHATMTEQNADCVFLDMTVLGRDLMIKRFPNILSSLMALGIDPVTEMVPVAPAAHYFMGGVLADVNGCTSKPGLLAIGECASTGLHGANRLASNSLLEGGVMALRAARQILVDGPGIPSSPRQEPLTSCLVPSDVLQFRRSMYDLAGLVRDERGLASLLKRVAGSAVEVRAINQDNFQSANMFLVGQLMAQAALRRHESRGSHWRFDYPQADDRLFNCRLAVCGQDWRSISSGHPAVSAPAFDSPQLACSPA